MLKYTAAASIVGVLIALYQSDLAALYVAIAAPMLLYMLHVVEVKLNRLLDYHDIYVSDKEKDAW